MSHLNSDKKEAASMERPSSPQAEIGESQKFDARQTDEAATYLNNAEHYEPLSPEEDKKFKRKMDWILLPMV